MDPHGKSSKTISIGVAEFINRLFVNGHLAEKSIFVIAVAVLGVTSGFFLGRYTMTQQIVALNQRSNINAKNINRAVASAPANPIEVKPIEVAKVESNLEKVKGSEVSPDDTGAALYYTIRIASSKSKAEIEKTMKKYESQCGHVESEFSSKLKRHIAYCGKFVDLVSAEIFLEKLSVDGKLIVHRKISSVE